MRFGIVLTLFPGQWSEKEVFKFILRQVDTAVENGFEAVFSGHHFVTGPDSRLPHPLAILPFVAGRHPGTYVGTSILLAPFFHPVMLAEQVAALDHLADGRLILGIGQGYREQEFAAMELERASRGARMREVVHAMRVLWAQDNASYHGSFYNFDGVSLGIKPTRSSGPPVLIGADTVATVSRVPEVGDHWLVSPRHSRSFLREAMPVYRAALEKQGRTFQGVPMTRDLCVGESRQAVEATMKAAFRDMYDLYQAWGRARQDANFDFNRLREDRIIAGNPDDVAEQVLSYHEEFGVEFMWFRTYWPGMDPELTIQTIRLFGREVIPRVRKEARASDRLI